MYKCDRYSGKSASIAAFLPVKAATSEGRGQNDLISCTKKAFVKKSARITRLWRRLIFIRCLVVAHFWIPLFFPVSFSASHVCNLKLVPQTCWISSTLWENLPQTNSPLTSKVPTNKKHETHAELWSSQYFLDILLSHLVASLILAPSHSSFLCVHPRFVLQRVSGKYRRDFGGNATQN